MCGLPNRGITSIVVRERGGAYGNERRGKDGTEERRTTSSFSSSRTLRKDFSFLVPLRWDVLYRRRRSELRESESKKKGETRPVVVMGGLMGSSTSRDKSGISIKGRGASSADVGDGNVDGGDESLKQSGQSQRQQQRHERCVLVCGWFGYATNEVCMQWCKIGMPIDLSPLMR